MHPLGKPPLSGRSFPVWQEIKVFLHLCSFIWIPLFLVSLFSLRKTHTQKTINVASDTGPQAQFILLLLLLCPVPACVRVECPSIQPSIYPSIYPSSHQSIYYLYCFSLSGVMGALKVSNKNMSSAKIKMYLNKAKIQIRRKIHPKDSWTWMRSRGGVKDENTRERNR